MATPTINANKQKFFPRRGNHLGVLPQTNNRERKLLDSILSVIPSIPTRDLDESNRNQDYKIPISNHDIFRNNETPLENLASYSPYNSNLADGPQRIRIFNRAVSLFSSVLTNDQRNLPWLEGQISNQYDEQSYKDQNYLENTYKLLNNMIISMIVDPTLNYSYEGKQEWNTGTISATLSKKTAVFNHSSPVIMNAGYNDYEKFNKVIESLLAGDPSFTSGGDFEKAQNGGSSLSKTSDKGKALYEGLECFTDPNGLYDIGEWAIIGEDKFYRFLNATFRSPESFSDDVIPATRKTALSKAKTNGNIPFSVLSDRKIDFFSTLNLVEKNVGSYTFSPIGANIPCLILRNGAFDKIITVPNASTYSSSEDNSLTTTSLTGTENYAYACLFNVKDFAAYYDVITQWRVSQSDTFSMQNLNGLRRYIKLYMNVKGTRTAFIKIKVS